MTIDLNADPAAEMLMQCQSEAAAPPDEPSDEERVAAAAAYRAVQALTEQLPAAVAMAVLEGLPEITPAAPAGGGGVVEGLSQDDRRLLKELKEKLTRPAGDMNAPENKAHRWREIMRMTAPRLISNDLKPTLRDKIAVFVALAGGRAKVTTLAAAAILACMIVGAAGGVAVDQAVNGAPLPPIATVLWRLEAPTINKCGADAPADGTAVECGLIPIKVRK
ncbi:MAG TPA: hypothetical protein VN809_01675 [Telmatospirillum sp.]|nr:hypothetical protein [Telmatospirillum sp.]